MSENEDREWNELVAEQPAYVEEMVKELRAWADGGESDYGDDGQRRQRRVTATGRKKRHSGRKSGERRISEEATGHRERVLEDVDVPGYDIPRVQRRKKETARWKNELRQRRGEAVSLSDADSGEALWSASERWGGGGRGRWVEQSENYDVPMNRAQRRIGYRKQPADDSYLTEEVQRIVAREDVPRARVRRTSGGM